ARSSSTSPFVNRILDVGTGAGNFSVLLAQALPQCSVIHLDSNPAMCAIASQKAARPGVKNHRIACAGVHSAQFPPQSIAAIVAVHSLYAMTAPESAIRLMTGPPAPGGRIFACDAGRPVRRSRLDAIHLEGNV